MPQRLRLFYSILTGVLLLILGIAMLIAEAHLPTHGILGASGVAALVASGLLLYNTNSSAFQISAPTRTRPRGAVRSMTRARAPISAGAPV